MNKLQQGTTLYTRQSFDLRASTVYSGSPTGSTGHRNTTSWPRSLRGRLDRYQAPDAHGVPYTDSTSDRLPADGRIVRNSSLRPVSAQFYVYTPNDLEYVPGGFDIPRDVCHSNPLSKEGCSHTIHQARATQTHSYPFSHMSIHQVRATQTHFYPFPYHKILPVCLPLREQRGSLYSRNNAKVGVVPNLLGCSHGEVDLSRET